MKVQNMKSKKSGKEVVNQFVITERDYIAFQSYDTLICEFITFVNKPILGYDAVLRVSKMYNYNRTTSKYFSQFLQEVGIEAKSCLKALKSDKLYFENNGKDIALVIF